jgi:cupin fold WbuC family metalloprotein
MTDMRSSEIDFDQVRRLQKSAQVSKKQRARISLHKNDESEVHVMLISLFRNSHIPIHKHADREEFYVLLEGRVRINLFSDRGEIIKFVELERPSDVKAFTFYMEKGDWHNLEVLSEHCLLLEVTQGPFNPLFTSTMTIS